MAKSKWDAGSLPPENPDSLDLAAELIGDALFPTAESRLRAAQAELAVLREENERRAAAIDTLALWAVRYAVGRMTYVTGLVGETVIAHKGLLSENTRLNILKAVEEAPDLGHDCDIAEWEKVRAALSGEDEVRA